MSIVGALVLAALVAGQAADPLPPLALSRRPRAGEPKMGPRGDVSEMAARHPEATWLPLEITADLHLRTTVSLEGHDVPVIIDTGAARTTLSTKVASLIGLDRPGVVRTPVKVTDAHGKQIDGYAAAIGTITLGAVRVHQVVATVVPGFDQNLLGYDVLRNVDLVFAADEGVVGIYAPGKGKLTARDNVVRIKVDTAAHVLAPVDDSGRNAIDFTLDTGATHTVVSDTLGRDMGLKVDRAFKATLSSVGGSRDVDGVFVIDDLHLGRERVDVGAVRAWRGDGATSLLGNDVNLRHRALLSSENAELRFAPMPIRPSKRSVGPDGKTRCGRDEPVVAVPGVDAGVVDATATRFVENPCVEAAVGQAKGAPCIGLGVDRVWAGKRISAIVEVLDDDGENAMAGGWFVFRALVPEGGLALCLPAGRTLPAYGIKTGQAVSLMRFTVDDDAARDCKGTICWETTAAAVP